MRLLRFIAFLWIVSEAGDVAGQSTVRIPDAPACECRIAAELVATLSDADGTAGLSAPIVMERTHDGRYLVVLANRQDVIQLFDASGRFQRTIGRAGQGPLEFRSILAIRRGPADSTYLMDAGNGRLAVLDPALRPTRSARIPAMGGWFGVLPDGKVIVLGATPRPGSREYRIQMLNRSLEPIDSFMPSVSQANASPASLRRRMSVSSAGVVAVAHYDRYTLEMWTSDGKHLQTLTRNPDWFPINSESPPGEAPDLKRPASAATVMCGQCPTLPIATGTALGPRSAIFMAGPCKAFLRVF